MDTTKIKELMAKHYPEDIRLENVVVTMLNAANKMQKYLIEQGYDLEELRNGDIQEIVKQKSKA